MVGAEAMAEALADDEIEAVTVIVRRPVQSTHPKLHIVIHKNFSDYSGLTQLFQNHDACLWCLGISQTLVSKDEYYMITYEYTIAAAKAIAQTSPNMTFLFVSGMGADPSEKSRTLFARVKGKTENALQTLPLKRLIIVRPGGIEPVRPRENAPTFEKMFAPLYPILRRIAPSFVITSSELARVMIYLVKHDLGNARLSNRDMKQLLKDI